MTGLDRMLYMDSTSDSSGSAAVTLTFAPGTDPDIAWAKVQNKLQLAMPALPDVVQQTGVTVSKSTRNYLLIAGVISEDGSMDNADLSDYIVSKIESVIGRVPGVGEVQVFGTAYSMRVWLDPDKLTKYGMTSDDVVAGAPRLQRRGLGRPARRRSGRAGPAAQRLDPRAVAPEDAGGVRGGPAPDERGRLGREGEGRRPDRARDRDPRPQVPVQREAGRGLRRPAGGGGERARDRRPGQGEDGGALEVLPARHEGHLRLRHDALREGRDRRGLQDAPRGDRPRLPRHVPLPRELPGDADPDDRRPGRPPRHLRRPRPPRLLDQHADDVRAWSSRSASSSTTRSSWSRTSSGS